MLYSFLGVLLFIIIVYHETILNKIMSSTTSVMVFASICYIAFIALVGYGCIEVAEFVVSATR